MNRYNIVKKGNKYIIVRDSTKKQLFDWVFDTYEQAESCLDDFLTSL